MDNQGKEGNSGRLVQSEITEGKMMTENKPKNETVNENLKEPSTSGMTEEKVVTPKKRKAGQLSESSVSSGSETNETGEQNIRIRIRKKKLVTGEHEVLENCKNLQAQIAMPSSEREVSENEQVTTSLKIQKVILVVRREEVTDWVKREPQIN